jgi:hypothetical protein
MSPPFTVANREHARRGIALFSQLAAELAARAGEGGP